MPFSAAALAAACFFFSARRWKKRKAADDGGGDEEGDEIIHGDEFLEAIAHVEGQTDVDESEDGEGVAKRTMNDVPHMKDLLGAREK